MHVDKVAGNIITIRKIWNGLQRCGLSPKVATAADIREMQSRIDDVVERYKKAVDNDMTHIPMIKKDINYILYKLKHWTELQNVIFEKNVKKLCEIWLRL